MFLRRTKSSTLFLFSPNLRWILPLRRRLKEFVSRLSHQTIHLDPIFLEYIILLLHFGDITSALEFTDWC
jgi:hypothetical protein